MLRSIVLGPFLGVMACATTTTPGAQPHDMSAEQHREEAASHAATADEHAAKYDSNLDSTRNRCRSRAGGNVGTGADLAENFDICWTSITNPTATHLREAAEHRRHAADHRAASAALVDAEGRACTGVSPHDRDLSPFERVDDIASVEAWTERLGTAKAGSEKTVGAVIVFRAVPGMTEEALGRLVACHLARNASLGHVAPEMPNCPLVPKGAEAKVSTSEAGVSVAIRSEDPAVAEEILARAKRLKGAN